MDKNKYNIINNITNNEVIVKLKTLKLCVNNHVLKQFLQNRKPNKYEILQNKKSLLSRKKVQNRAKDLYSSNH